MIIRHKKPFYIGAILLAGFFSLFYFLLTPVFSTKDGPKLTGLEYADEVFNCLSKGSSDFFPQTFAAARSMEGKDVSLSAGMPKKLRVTAVTLLRETGIEPRMDGNRIIFQGNLGRILLAATEDSRLLFNNSGGALIEKYGGLKPLAISGAWWHLLAPTVKKLEIMGKNAESRAVGTVVVRGIEPANNFYGIQALKVSENIPLISGFLLFYIIYTIWYGFAVYEIFKGFGLIATKEEIEKAECGLAQDED